MEGATTGGSAEPARGAVATEVYASFLEALNRQDLEGASRCVNAERYRENCVDFTRGFVDWEAAKASIQTIWKALPDLRVELHNLAGAGDFALARGTARGTALGRLYGAPATKRTYQASFFDYVRIDDGLIVERVQQADVLGQMRQLYGRAFGLVGVAAMFFKQKPPS
jgi:predicted ester cyclase